jgi:hypothetical protein
MSRRCHHPDRKSGEATSIIAREKAADFMPGLMVVLQRCRDFLHTPGICAERCPVATAQEVRLA